MIFIQSIIVPASLHVYNCLAEHFQKLRLSRLRWTANKYSQKIAFESERSHLFLWNMCSPKQLRETMHGKIKSNIL